MKKALLFLLFFAVMGLSVPVAAQSEPTAILIAGENTDQPHSQIIYRVGMDGDWEAVITLENRWSVPSINAGLIQVSDEQAFDLTQPDPQMVLLFPAPAPDYQARLDELLDVPFTPLSKVQGIELSAFTVFVMAGEENNFINFYRVGDGKLIQLTDVIALFPEAQTPILSASVDFIAERPQLPGFLYRARVRDANGEDFNALYFYDLSAGESEPMPFFGKNPVWSPDGIKLAGSRLGRQENGQPIYHIWTVNLFTTKEVMIAPGCNPQWSPDGERLAYDQHENVEWQGYVDCFANGQVEAYHLATEEKVSLSAGLAGFVQLVGWLP